MLKLKKKEDELFYFETEDGEELICKVLGAAVEVISNVQDGIYALARRLENVFSKEEIFPKELTEFNDAWIVCVKSGDFKCHLALKDVTIKDILYRWTFHQNRLKKVSVK